MTADLHGGREILPLLSLVFGVAYLPWQFLHLGVLRTNGETGAVPVVGGIAHGLRRAIELKNYRTDAKSWGGIVGLIWMAGYWATLIPIWLFYIVKVFAGHRV